MMYELSSFALFFVSLFSCLGLLFCNWREEQPKLILGIFMFSATLFFGINTLRVLGNLQLYNYLYVFYYSSLLIPFPSLFIYVKSLNEKNNLLNKLFIHLIPFGIIFFIGSIIYFELNYSQRILFITNLSVNNVSDNIYMQITQGIFIFVQILLIMQLLFYTYPTIKLLKLYRKEINNIFSANSKMKINWTSLLFFVLIIYAVILVIGSGVSQKISINNNITVIFDIITIVIIFILYLIGSKWSGLYSGYAESSNTGEQKKNDLKERLITLFEKKEIFLKKELTIWDVCIEVYSNRSYISNVINEEFQLNFNSFVNYYRIEKAKQLLKNKEFVNLPLQTIADKSGFNSQVSFNRAFRKFENTSPGKYKEGV